MSDATDTPSDPSNPFSFPPELVEAQKAAAEAYEALHRYQATLPWSRVPHDGWEAPTPAHGGALVGPQSSRPATQGWTSEQGAEYDRLWEACRTTSAAVSLHPHWATFSGADQFEARQALKRMPGALPAIKPVEQDDMATAV
ncbi:hypothetical protein AB0I69_42655 [Streptomyces sp. NPDC050508]|uniref:hypothetical protein n=1 Tax=Streptomyces sp. NPDC050508 TaxID=3155405 RepID=UPI0034295B00